MYTVLIADDERTVLEGISSFIPWIELDCCVVYQAVNGIQAKEIIDSNHIDIAILDIHMPGLSGLELSEYLAIKYPEIGVVILTAYADFSYIQNAIRCNVVDYVIKTTYETELPAAIKKTISTINSRLNQIRKLSITSSLHTKDAKAELLQKLIGATKEEIQNPDEYTRQMPVLSNEYFITLFRLFPYEDGNMIIDKMLVNSLQHIFYNINLNSGYTFLIPDNTILVIVNCRESFTKGISQIHACYLSILSCLQKSNFSLKVGISTQKNDVFRFNEAYNEASAILINTKIKSGIHQYASDSKLTNINRKKLSSLLKNAINYLELGKFEDTRNSFNETLQFMRQHQLSLETIRYTGTLIFSIYFSYLRSNDIAYKEVAELNLYNTIRNAKTPSMIFNQITAVMEYFSSQTHNNYSTYSDFVQKTLEHLNQHYTEKVTLNSISSNIHVNASYLCRVFKKETGSSVIDTLNSLRIKKAMKLLESKKYKIAEVANAVGIPDPCYFTHVFSRYSGKSPKDYCNQEIINILPDLL